MRLIDKGTVYVTSDCEGVLILMPNRYTPESLEIAFIEGSEDSLVSLEAFAKQKLAGASGEGWSYAFSAGDKKKAIIERIGIKLHEDISYVYVFDYPLQKTV